MRQVPLAAGMAFSSRSARRRALVGGGRGEGADAESVDERVELAQEARRGAESYTQ